MQITTHKRCHISPKLKISKIQKLNFVAGPRTSLYTKISLADHFSLTSILSSAKVVPKWQRKKSKIIAVFWPKISQVSNFS